MKNCTMKEAEAPGYVMLHNNHIIAVTLTTN